MGLGGVRPPMPVGMQTQPTPRLWRRATATGAFTAIATDPAVRTGQSWYDWYVQGDPTSDASVYVGEINLFRVDRQGRTWVWTNLSSKTNADSIHPDQHCLTYDPANGQVIYAGCDGGVYRSRDRGANWGDLNDGLAITEIEYLAQDVGSSRWLLAGTQDNGRNRYVANPVWDHVADGDGGDAAPVRPTRTVSITPSSAWGSNDRATRGTPGPGSRPATAIHPCTASSSTRRSRPTA